MESREGGWWLQLSKRLARVPICRFSLAQVVSVSIRGHGVLPVQGAGPSHEQDATFDPIVGVAEPDGIRHFMIL
jgi:hypothetical protein